MPYLPAQSSPFPANGRAAGISSALVALLLGSLGGCARRGTVIEDEVVVPAAASTRATGPAARSGSRTTPTPAPSWTRVKPNHPAVARRATALLGKRRIWIEGRAHRADCSGLVKGLYRASGHDLYALGALGKENGVAIIFRYVKRYGQLHLGRPQAGELAFFDNSYDRNKDGRRNDPLTHIGVVEKVRRDGTVVVIHFGSGSVRRLLVNTHAPSMRRNARGEPINDYLRREKDGPRLAGELLVAWGRLPPPGQRRMVARK